MQIVGERDSGLRPHVDSLKLCNLAAVLHLTYKSDMVHSVAGYFGREHRERRMTALFFWMSK